MLFIWKLLPVNETITALVVIGLLVWAGVLDLPQLSDLLWSYLWPF